MDPLPTAIVFARALAGGSLAAAGLVKLHDRPAFRHALSGLGVPTAFAGLTAVALPSTEILFGTMLAGASLFEPDMVVLSSAANGCLALYLLFAAVLAGNLAQGRSELSCGCFGTRSERITWALVGRNVVLSLACIGAASPGAIPSEARATGVTLAVGAFLLWLLGTTIHRIVAATWRETSAESSMRGTS